MERAFALPTVSSGARHEREARSAGASSLFDGESAIMPGVDFNVLRSEVTMREVLAVLGWQSTSRAGDQLHGPCPVHGSSSPRSRTLSVNLAEGRYYCHKCHSQGNQLELWAAVHNHTIYQAAIDLCHVLGRDVPWIERW